MILMVMVDLVAVAVADDDDVGFVVALEVLGKLV